MSSRKRNTKQRRREPVRRAIPASAIGARPDTDRRRLPSLLGKLLNVPVETLPLYAALAIVQEELAAGGHLNSCVPICHQLAIALSHLGIEAEPMAAHVTVARLSTEETVAEIGVIDSPKVRADGTTDGHMVLWVEGMSRLADPTIMQIPEVLAAARRDNALGLPSVLPLPGGRAQLLSTRPAMPRPPYLLVWTILPDWTDRMGGVLVGDRAAAMPYGGLAMAHTALDLIRTVGERRDLAGLDQYPRIAELLAGTEKLPPLPGQPPATFLKIRAEAGMVSSRTGAP